MSGVPVVPLIERKKRGGELSAQELEALLDGYVRGDVPDYQVAAWLMAVCWRGMGEAETLALTRAMVASGDVLEWEGIGRPTVDKHSTGGVGDKVSLVIAPLLASCGLPIAMLTGRGLGHTGGTMDKLESIPGLDLGLDRARKSNARRRRDGVDQRAPHAPTSARHDQPHVGHGSSLLLGGV